MINEGPASFFTVWTMNIHRKLISYFQYVGSTQLQWREKRWRNILVNLRKRLHLPVFKNKQNFYVIVWSFINFWYTEIKKATICAVLLYSLIGVGLKKMWIDPAVRSRSIHRAGFGSVFLVTKPIRRPLSQIIIPCIEFCTRSLQFIHFHNLFCP